MLCPNPLFLAAATTVVATTTTTTTSPSSPSWWSFSSCFGRTPRPPVAACCAASSVGIAAPATARKMYGDTRRSYSATKRASTSSPSSIMWSSSSLLLSPSTCLSSIDSSTIMKNSNGPCCNPPPSALATSSTDSGDLDSSSIVPERGVLLARIRTGGVATNTCSRTPSTTTITRGGASSLIVTSLRLGWGRQVVARATSSSMPTRRISTSTAALLGGAGAVLGVASRTARRIVVLQRLLTRSTPIVTYVLHAMRGGSATVGTSTADTATTAAAASSAIGEMVFNLERAKIRLDGLNSYGVVTALLMGAALSIFSASPRKLDNNKLDNVAKILLTIAVSASVLAGSHATVVYTLVGIYSKSALGMSKDEAFIEFMTQTTAIRKNAFESFLISLVSFNVSFILSIFLNFTGMTRWYISGSIALFSMLNIWSWLDMMNVASNIIFSH